MPDGCQSLRQINCSQLQACIERVVADIGYSRLHHRGGDLCPISIPGSHGRCAVIGHTSVAGNGQGSVLCQDPAQAIVLAELPAGRTGQHCQRLILHGGLGQALRILIDLAADGAGIVFIVARCEVSRCDGLGLDHGVALGGDDLSFQSGLLLALGILEELAAAGAGIVGVAAGGGMSGGYRLGKRQVMARGGGGQASPCSGFRTLGVGKQRTADVAGIVLRHACLGAGNDGVHLCQLVGMARHIVDRRVQQRIIVKGNGDVLPVCDPAVVSHIRQAGAAVKRIVSHRGELRGERHSSNMAAVIKRKAADARNAGFCHNGSNPGPVTVPGSAGAVGIVRHGPGAGDGQRAVLVHSPGQVIAAGVVGQLRQSLVGNFRHLARRRVQVDAVAAGAGIIGIVAFFRGGRRFGLHQSQRMNVAADRAGTVRTVHIVVLPGRFLGTHGAPPGMLAGMAAACVGPPIALALGSLIALGIAPPAAGTHSLRQMDIREGICGNVVLLKVLLGYLGRLRLRRNRRFLRGNGGLFRRSLLGGGCGFLGGGLRCLLHRGHVFVGMLLHRICPGRCHQPEGHGQSHEQRKQFFHCVSLFLRAVFAIRHRTYG